MPTIPAIPHDCTVLAAAFAYTSSGLYIGPLRQGSKNPGSVLGSWPSRTFNDAESAAAWFAGTNHGVFLHCGRSGLVVLDVDAPEAVPAEWWPLLDAMPFQRSRPGGDPRRGHYLAAVPPGRRIGNATGTARKGWGEVRGDNGVIVLAPTIHEKAAEGARYEWVRTGPVPTLGDLIAATLPEGGDRSSACSDDAVTAWLGAHVGDGLRPTLADRPVRDYLRLHEAGSSRHETAVRSAAWMCREIAAGLYPAAALDTLEAVFRDGFTPTERSRGRGTAREWRGILAWAIAQITAGDIAKVQVRHGIVADGGRDPLEDSAEGTWASWS